MDEKAEQWWKELDDEEDALDQQDEHGENGNDDVPVRYAVEARG